MNLVDREDTYTEYGLSDRHLIIMLRIFIVHTHKRALVDCLDFGALKILCMDKFQLTDGKSEFRQ